MFTTFCESHTIQVPFHAVARLLRATTGVGDLDASAARTQVRARVPDAEPEDLVLFDDLLGIGDPKVELPKIDPDARRRRLTALVNSASLARETPAVYVVEDLHWIDEVSESMVADFVVVIPETPSVVLVERPPRISGRVEPGARCAEHRPGAAGVIRKPQHWSPELLGPHSSVGGLATLIAERAAGNPFFVEEMVRELADRGVLRGNRGAYLSTADAGEVGVPATLQATIAARIDRLDPAAKRTLKCSGSHRLEVQPGPVGERWELTLSWTIWSAVS